MAKGPIPVFLSKTNRDGYTVTVATDTSQVAVVGLVFMSPLLIAADWLLNVFGPLGLIIGAITLFCFGWWVTRTWIGRIVGQFAVAFVVTFIATAFLALFGWFIWGVFL